MKKFLVAVLAVGMLSFSANAGGKDDMVDGGVFIHTGLFMPSGAYGSLSKFGDTKIDYDKEFDEIDFNIGGTPSIIFDAWLFYLFK